MAAKILNINLGEQGDERVDVSLGVYHTPSEFIQQAMSLTHPFDRSEGLDDEFILVMFELLSEGFGEVFRRRDVAFAKYESLMRSLENGEYDVHRSLPPEKEEILKDKKLLLFKKMCEDANVKDPKLFEHLCHGISLVGEASVTGEFPLKEGCLL